MEQKKGMTFEEIKRNIDSLSDEQVVYFKKVAHNKVGDFKGEDKKVAEMMLEFFIKELARRSAAAKLQKVSVEGDEAIEEIEVVAEKTQSEKTLEELIDEQEVKQEEDSFAHGRLF